MSGRRAARPLAVGLALVALMLPCAAAGADPHNPTPAELQAAQQRVSDAKHQVTTLQAQAEHAAEEYNGALVRAQHLQAASATRAVAAQSAQYAYQGALASAQSAQALADLASASARAAAVVQAQAEAEAAAAQLTIDRIAIGAFQNDGQLGMVSQLFMAKDPIELANGRNIMNHVGAYQTHVIAVAVAARLRATRATEAAHAAAQTATATAATAAAALVQATAARDAAQSAERSARAAASAAARGVQDAAAARRLALAFVARAEASLGWAVRSAAQLQAEAVAARASAGSFNDATAPSDQARIAIHWAYNEIGVPYSWGGGTNDGPSEGFAQGAGTVGFDCSGLTMFVYHKAGIQLDHYTGSQWDQGKRISNRADLLPGDLVYFAYDTNDPSTIHHVALYIGNGKMIEAPHTGAVVRVSSMYDSGYIGATRPWA